MKVENIYFDVEPLTAAGVEVEAFLKRRGTIYDIYFEFARSLGGRPVLDRTATWPSGLKGVAFDADPGEAWREIPCSNGKAYAPRRNRVEGKAILARWPKEQFEGMADLTERLGFGHAGGVICGDRMYSGIGMVKDVRGHWLVHSYEFFGPDAPTHKLVDGLVPISAQVYHSACGRMATEGDPS